MAFVSEKETRGVALGWPPGSTLETIQFSTNTDREKNSWYVCEGKSDREHCYSFFVSKKRDTDQKVASWQNVVD